MRLILFVLGVVLLATSCATRGKYESADVELDPSYRQPGTIRFSVDLVKPSGRRKHLRPNRDVIKWSRLSFSGDNVLSSNQGYLHYKMDRFTKENHTLKVKLYSEKYGFQKDFSLTVPYVKSIAVKTTSIELNKNNPIDYDLILNDDSRIPQNTNHFSNDLLLNKSDSLIQIVDGDVIITSDVPLLGIKPHVLLLHKITKDTLWNANLNIDYPSEKSYNYSGNSGEAGRQGYDGRNASESGSNGGNGANGNNAADVNLYLQYYQKAGQEFIVLTVENNGRRETSFIPKSTGRILVYAQGGNGGNGGRGGNGKDAAYPVTTTTNGKTTTTKPSLYGGDSGHGGDAGHGGRGGNISIYMDEKLVDFRNSISIENRGGQAGMGGQSGSTGRGMNAKGSLGGIFNNTNGKNGMNGRNGISGTDGKVDGPVLLTGEELVRRFSFLKKLK